MSMVHFTMAGLHSRRLFQKRSFQSFSTISRIGFIGLGQMGAHMVKNIIRKSDHSLYLHDINQESLKDIQRVAAEQQHGNKVTVVGSPREIAQMSDVIITMLPTFAHVEDVYINSEKGILSPSHPISSSLTAASSPKILIDSSTVGPSAAKSLGQIAKKYNVNFIDAPVSGGVVGAENGTLAFMVGGSKEILDQVSPILNLMGSKIIHCGDIGNGQIAKVCNNMLLAITMMGTCEVLHLGKKLGMDPSLLSQVINTSTGRCWSSEIYNPVPGIIANVPSSNKYAGGFTNLLMAKDLNLASQASSDVKANVFLGNLARQLYNWLSNHPEYAKKDFSSFYQFLDQNK